MDHIEDNLINPIWNSDLLFKLDSDNTTDDIISKQSSLFTCVKIDHESLYWYIILYTIGSHIIETSEHIKEREIDISHDLTNFITKLFCGYWVLYNISESDTIN